MPLEAIVEWGITLFIFAVIMLACAQAVWPVRKPHKIDFVQLEDYMRQYRQETRAVAEARAIIEHCWSDDSQRVKEDFYDEI